MLEQCSAAHYKFPVSTLAPLTDSTHAGWNCLACWVICISLALARAKGILDDSIYLCKPDGSPYQYTAQLLHHNLAVENFTCGIHHLLELIMLALSEVVCFVPIQIIISKETRSQWQPYIDGDLSYKCRQQQIKDVLKIQVSIINNSKTAFPFEECYLDWMKTSAVSIHHRDSTHINGRAVNCTETENEL